MNAQEYRWTGNSNNNDFFDELNAIGSIPISLTRWEMTGLKPALNIH